MAGRVDGAQRGYGRIMRISLARPFASLGVHEAEGYTVRMIRASSAKIAALAAGSAIILLTAGCASTGAKKGDTAYVARDVESLYSAAKSRLDRGDAKTAAALFDETERQHPYSPWARRAQLMSAFSYYTIKDYNAAIKSAQRFLSVHPGNRDAPYAYYLIAISYYEQISDVTRDQAITEQALNALTEVQRRYPNSAYAADAALKIDLVHDHLAGKDMEIGRFYQTRGNWLAAQLRFRNVVEKYQTTSHAAEALYRLTETNLALGVPEEAKRYAAVLGANYPGSEWYDRAFSLMRSKAPSQI